MKQISFVILILLLSGCEFIQFSSYRNDTASIAKEQIVVSPTPSPSPSPTPSPSPSPTPSPSPSPTPSPSPAQSPIVCTAAKPYQHISRGTNTTCGISNNQLYCWGMNYWGQYGNGTATTYVGGNYQYGNESTVPLLISAGWKKVGLSNTHTCGLTLDDYINCWGRGDIQLGYDGHTVTSTYVPHPIYSNGMTDGGKFRQLAVGAREVCGITKTTEELYCWGMGVYQGQPWTGLPTRLNLPSNFTLPIKHLSLATPYGDAISGSFNMALVDASGKIFTRAFPPSAPAYFSQVPAPALQPSEVFENVSVGTLHYCGVTNLSKGYCWGKETYSGGSYGSLGNGAAEGDKTSPFPIDTSLMPLADRSFLQIEAGLTETCGLTTTRKIYCWGSDYRRFGVAVGAQNGTGLEAPKFAIDTAAIQGSKPFIRLNMSSSGACAITSDQMAFCWGDNNYGQNGNGGAVPYGSWGNWPMTPQALGGDQTLVCQ